MPFALAVELIAPAVGVCLLLVILFVGLLVQYSITNNKLTAELASSESKLAVLTEQLKEAQVSLHKMASERDQDMVRARKDAAARSRTVMRGQSMEQMAPLQIPQWDIKDFKFLGQPVDYVVYQGLGSVLDNAGNEIEEVAFLEIKTGSSQLNTAQRRIRDAIAAGRVAFYVYNLDTHKMVRSPPLSED